MKRVKATKTDFTEFDLPRTRKDGFFDLLKTQYPKLLLLGFVMFIGFLPLFLSYAGRILLEVSYTSDGLPIAQAKAMSHLLFGVIDIVCLFFLFFLLAGCLRVIRQFLYLEPVFFWSDLWRGCKQNGLKFGLFGIFISILYFLVGFLADSFYGAVMLGVLIVTVIPCVLWCLGLVGFYKIRFSVMLRNSFVLYLKNFWSTLAFTALLFVVYGAVVLYCPFLLISLLILVLYVLFGFPIVFSAMTSKFMDVFDEQVNKKSFPELYRKGLMQEIDEEV